MAAKKRITKKLALVLGMTLVLSCLVCAGAGTVLAKYLHSGSFRNLYVAGGFYFESDILQATPTPAYNLSAGEKNLQFHLYNYTDNLRYTAMNIPYTVSVKKDGVAVGENIVGTLAGGTKSEATIDVEFPAAGTYTVVVTTGGEIFRELQASFNVTDSGSALSDLPDAPDFSALPAISINENDSLRVIYTSQLGNHAVLPVHYNTENVTGPITVDLQKKEGGVYNTIDANCRTIRDPSVTTFFIPRYLLQVEAGSTYETYRLLINVYDNAQQNIERTAVFTFIVVNDGGYVSTEPFNIANAHKVWDGDGTHIARLVYSTVTEDYDEDGHYDTYIIDADVSLNNGMYGYEDSAAMKYTSGTVDNLTSWAYGINLMPSGPKDTYWSGARYLYFYVENITGNIQLNLNEEFWLKNGAQSISLWDGADWTVLTTESSWNYVKLTQSGQYFSGWVRLDLTQLARRNADGSNGKDIGEVSNALNSITSVRILTTQPNACIYLDDFYIDGRNKDAGNGFQAEGGGNSLYDIYSAGADRILVGSVPVAVPSDIASKNAVIVDGIVATATGNEKWAAYAYWDIQADKYGKTDWTGTENVYVRLDCKTDGLTDFVLSSSGKHYDRAANRLLFKLATPVTQLITVNETSGNAYTLEANITVHQFIQSYPSLQLVLGYNAAGNKVKLEIAESSIRVVEITGSGENYLATYYRDNSGLTGTTFRLTVKVLATDIHVYFNDGWITTFNQDDVAEYNAANSKNNSMEQQTLKADSNFISFGSYNVDYTLEDMWILTPEGNDSGASDQWAGTYIEGDKTFKLLEGAPVYIWNVYTQTWEERISDEWGHVDLGIYYGYVKIPITSFPAGIPLDNIRYVGVYIPAGSISVERIYTDQNQ